MDGPESLAAPFEPTTLEETSVKEQPQVLNPVSIDGGAERRVAAFSETDYQSHRNVYVGLHMPYNRSSSRHKGHHRHKRRHSSHRHNSGHGHHGDGHHHHDNGSYESTLQEYQGDRDQVDGNVGRSLSADRAKGSDSNIIRLQFEGRQPKYNKSCSLPAGHYSVPELQVPVEPKTPSDPCDRVKFILGGDYDDQTDHNDCNTIHSIFTELEELKYDEHEQRMEWKETARWIKFEEDVEEGGNKWSKPHVASLSLHSLFELRSCIFKGTVLLDLKADNLAMISDLVLDNLVSTGQLEEESREKVRQALLQRHHHLNSRKEHGENRLLDHIKSLGDIGRHSSKDFEGSLTGGGGSRNGSRRGSAQIEAGLKNWNGLHHGSIHIDSGLRNGSVTGIRLLAEENIPDSEQDFTQFRKLDSGFMKKIPPGSEASNVLVGEVDFLSHPIIAFVRLARGQYLGDLTEVPIPTRFIFIMLGPTGHQERYHEIGRSISTLMSDEVFHEVAYKARNRGDLMAGIDEFLDKVTVLPPGEWDPQIRLEPPSTVPSQANRKNMTDSTKISVDVPAIPFKCKHCKVSMDHPPPVKWSKRPFQGLLNDMTQCYGLYRSDLGDAFSLQSVASLILIYFANITLAFTFGAILSDYTNSTLGATETILAVGIGNFFYSIFSGQPLIILGPTGPTLIFEQIVFTFCNMHEVPFLEFRFWIGTWTAIFMFVLVGFNTSAITSFFTRFTAEIFTVVISFIFIFKAFYELWEIHMEFPYNQWLIYPINQRTCNCYQFADIESLKNQIFINATNLGSFWDNPFLNCSYSLQRRYVGGDCPDGFTESPDVFFMSVILFFGTFLFCIYFKKIRNSKFLKSYIRHVLSDFAVFIAVVVWVIVDVLAQVETPKLEVPSVFENGAYSKENRTFLIRPMGNDLPSWAPPAAILPALLATILLFMDQHITAIIVNRKDNKLKKNPGYHLDFFIIGCLIFLHSLLGLPWVVGATILSISHVHSLFLYSSRTAPGERPKFIGVREQRVTLFCMALLVGISIMAYNVLKLLPLPVLYGLVLYLGVSSLYGIQFIQRFVLFFIPNKHRPDFEYLRHIPNRKIYIFTAIQIVFLLSLCMFQVYFYLRVIFPLMVVTLVIGRWLLGFFFSKHDLELLDEPIPNFLYSKCCRTNQQKSKDLEGNLSLDTLGESSSHSSGQDLLAVTSEPLSHQHNLQDSHKDDFNITHEVDKCDLWKNMVKNLDAPLPSPRCNDKVKLEEGYSRGTAWMGCVGVGGELDTLEECDTDVESTVQLPDNEKVVLSPSNLVSPTSYSGGRDYETKEDRCLVYNTGDPTLTQFQSTAV